MSGDLRRRLRRDLGRFTRMGVAVAVLVAAVVVAGHRIRQMISIHEAYPVVSGQLGVGGLGAPLSIHRDERGIPHVEAAGIEDAFFGLGFVHAQDRLPQLRWLLRLATGRVSEVEGTAGLATDRLARTIDFSGLARSEFAVLDDRTHAVLAAYSRGVNAWMDRVRDRRASTPVSLPERASALEPWRPVDSLAVFKLYAWGLGASLEANLLLHDLTQQLGGIGARPFFPEALERRSRPGGSAVAAGPIGAGWQDPLRTALHLRGRTIGSSAWVLGRGHSATGAPILVADAHLETTAPSLYYVAHIRGGDLDVAGATIPGVPAVLTGRNTRVAWGATHARAVTTDLYEEKLRPGQPDTYFDGRRDRKLDVRVERIAVRGASPVEFTVRATRHGPLINPIVPGAHDPLALAWTGARSGARSGIASLLALASAVDETTLLAALSRHEEPPFAFVYATADGAAGMQVAGWIPRRAMASGLIPMNGRARGYDWDGRIPFEDLPGERVPVRGWAIAADNPFPSGPPGARVEWLWRPGTRARRIEALVRAAVAAGRVPLRSMSALQTDVTMDRARELIASAVVLAERGPRLEDEGREILDLLKGWSGRADPASTGAAAYHFFLESLTRRLLAPKLGDALLDRYLALEQADPDEVIFSLVRESAAGEVRDGWSDPAVVGPAVHASLRETWFKLSYNLGSNRSKWRWGRLHRLEFRSFGPGPSWGLASRKLGPFGQGGSSTTVATAAYDPNDPYDVRVAATFRFAVDASTLDQALVSLAPGQSGHPGHPHFDDGVDRWRDGRPHLLVTAPLLIEESSQSLLRLEPVP